MAGLKVIVGLGKTGYSCARYFERRGIPFAVMDSNPEPAYLGALRTLAPEAPFGGIDGSALLAAEEIVLSPGVPRSLAEIRAAIEAGVPLTGDVAMFAELADAPVVAVTGSNGKSTVTALVGEMARHCQVAAGVGGNIGVPCLDLLEQGYELYVIEISSYQLETAASLKSRVAVVLNLSPDHQDRYPDIDSYYRTKARIYRGCEYAVLNRDTTFDLDVPPGATTITFGTGAPPGPGDFGLVSISGTPALARGDTVLMAVSELALRGEHNYQNALAGLAIGTALGWPTAPMLQALREFAGLPHRCEPVASMGGVDYINDSKATNPGATLAAVNGLGTEEKNIILILGGIGKGADFSVLAEPLGRHVKTVYLYGRDRRVIANQLGDAAPKRMFDTLEQVVDDIRAIAAAGDLVLLSPACASQDQFANFEARGDAFRTLVRHGGPS